MALSDFVTKFISGVAAGVASTYAGIATTATSYVIAAVAITLFIYLIFRGGKKKRKY